MFRGLPTSKSCGRAWVAACQSIIATKDDAYNVVIDVRDAVNHDAKDSEVITLVNDFLDGHGANPIVTVANTIFPQTLYEDFGAGQMVVEYRRDFDKFARDGGFWGQYFDRMTRFHDPKDGVIDPLHELIGKMKGPDSGSAKYKSAYELTIYNPATDRKRLYGGPCLSYLSFKRHPEEGLLLTAVYRNHFYVSRLLGNLIGLGQLQAYVATQAKVKVGSLTVISTHAEMDSEGEWGIVEARNLVKKAAELYQS